MIEKDMKIFKHTKREELTLVFILGTVILSFFIMEVMFNMVSQNTTMVISHFFYFPIIFSALLFPRRGILISTFFGLFYLLIIYVMAFPHNIDLLLATMQFYVYVSVGVATSLLSGHIKTNQMKYQNIFEHSGSGICLVNSKTWELIESNHPCDLMFRKIGLTTSSATLNDLWPDEETRKDFLKKLKTDSTVSDYEMQLVNSHQKHEVLISAGTLPDNKIVFTITDITERKNDEERLKRQNNKLVTINGVIAAANSSESVNDCMETSLEMITRLPDYEMGAIFLTDGRLQKPKHVILKSRDKQNIPILENALKNLDITTPPYSDVFTDGIPKYLHSVKISDKTPQEPGESEQDLFSSLSIIPLIAGTKIVGGLILASVAQKEITPGEKKMLESIGKELGSVIFRNILHQKAEKSGKEANLYIDIMAHDINNANTVSLGYAELLDGFVDDKEQIFVSKLITGIRYSVRIIKQVSLIRKVHEKSSPLVSTDLDSVIENKIRMFPETKISYRPTGLKVTADSMLSDVFDNLITNSVSFGGEDAEIVIKAEEADKETVLVSVEDTGPGLTDTRKTGLFNRFCEGEISRHGKGLGLSICRMLVELYGGSIHAEDRVPDKPTEGLAIRFTLKKADLK